MSTEVDARQAAADSYEQYRALSTAAVAGLIVGLLSCLAILDWTLVTLPVAGVLISAWALVKVRKHRDELTGEALAKTGLGLSLLFGVIGPARLTYEYVTELPDGYARISYAELQPDGTQAGQQVPPAALALEGKKVYIKGYIYPGQQKTGIKRFLLARDSGECCFGGNPKLTERILVELDDPLRTNFETGVQKLGGTFHVEAQDNSIDGAKGGVFYHLKADYLQ